MNNRVCIICGKLFEHAGNNPEPIASKGVCCDECNIRYVIPARLKHLYTHPNAESEDDD